MSASPPIDSPPIDGPPIDGPPIDGPPIDGPPVDGPPVDGPAVGSAEGVDEHRWSVRDLVVHTQPIRDRWFTVIIVISFLYGVGPSIIQTLLASKYQTAIGQDTVPLTALAAKSSTYLDFVLLGTCVAAIVLSLGHIPTVNRAQLVILLAPWVYIVVRDDYLGIGVHLNVFIYPLVCVAAWFLRPRIATLEWLGYIVGFVSILSIALGVLLPLKGLYQMAGGTEVTVDKQIFSSGILVGPLSSGNNLGQFLVMGIATIGLVRRKTWRIVFFIACGYASLWAASRSCLIATGILIVLAVILHALPRALRPPVIFVALVGMIAVLIALPFVVTNPKSFSNRGYVWEVSKQVWHAHTWLGLGSNFYGRIAATSATLGGSVFHGHNQFMQDLVIGGWWLAIFMGMVFLVGILASMRLARRGFNIPALFMTGFIGACLMEVSYVLVDRYFALPVMLMPLACLLFTADHDLPVDTEPASDSDRSVFSGSQLSPPNRRTQPAGRTET